MNYKFILIVCTPRSASTTLQRIINTIPNSNITGENYGAIKSILECYKNIKKTLEITPKNDNGEFISSYTLEKKNMKPCFYNIFNFNSIKTQIKQLIIDIMNNNENNKILGFKEIRWYNCIQLLDEFLELFPNTKIICHIQEDVEKQSKSTFFKLNESIYNYLETYTKQIIEYSNNNKNCVLSTREKMFDFENIKNISLFLDEPINEDEYLTIINNDPERK